MRSWTAVAVDVVKVWNNVILCRGTIRLNLTPLEEPISLLWRMRQILASDHGLHYFSCSLINHEISKDEYSKFISFLILPHTYKNTESTVILWMPMAYWKRWTGSILWKETTGCPPCLQWSMKGSSYLILLLSTTFIKRQLWDCCFGRGDVGCFRNFHGHRAESGCVLWDCPDHYLAHHPSLRPLIIRSNDDGPWLAWPFYISLLPQQHQWWSLCYMEIRDQQWNNKITSKQFKWQNRCELFEHHHPFISPR